MNRYDNLDSRDLIDRKEELESERDSFTVTVKSSQGQVDEGEEVQDPEQWAIENPDDAEELAELVEVCEEGEGYSDWIHGETLIHEDNFADYVEESCRDCGYLSKDIPSWIVIDWEATAENVKADYTTIDYKGETYYIRCC